MDANHFDALTQRLTTRRNRRQSLAFLASLGLASLLAPSVAEAKKTKSCPPCKRRKKGKCKMNLPDGSLCPSGTCQSGSCVAGPPPRDTCSPPCGANQVCQTGTCVAKPTPPVKLTCTDGVKNGSETDV